MSKAIVGLLMLAVMLVLCIVLPCSANDEYTPIAGPAQINLDNALATLSLAGKLYFYDKKDTQEMLTSYGKTVDGGEVGLVVPQNDNWAGLLRYDETGYIKDKEADSLDADKLLQSIKNGTAEENVQRKSKGIPQLYVVNWDKKPTYNKSDHTLKWSIIGKSEDSDVLFLNYTAVVLGRHGILTCTVVSDYSDKSLALTKLDMVTSSIDFTQGKDYTSFRKGDKISDVTMAGLVTGGTAAAAYAVAKTGLLAKLGKFLIPLLLIFKKAIVLIFVPIIYLFKKIWEKISGK